MDDVVGVIGLGFVGGANCAGLASIGHQISVFDKDVGKLEALRIGRTVVDETTLNDRLAEAFSLGNLKLTFSLESLVADCECLFVCINTDGSRSDETGVAPLNCQPVIALIKEIRRISSVVKICIRSTLDPGAVDALIDANCGTKNLAVVPEFLREGSAFEDFIDCDRLVIGSEDSDLIKALSLLLGRFSNSIHPMTMKEAVYAKLISNSMLGLLISAANELDMHLTDQNCDTQKVLGSVVSDRRWVDSPLKNYFNPSIGFGGYCLPKDISAMSHFLAKEEVLSLFERALMINNQIPHYNLAKLIVQLKEKASTRVIFLGAAFKNFSEDCRFSPAVRLIAMLELGRDFEGEIVVVDPDCDKLKFADALVDWGFDKSIAELIKFSHCVSEVDLNERDFVVRLVANRLSKNDWLSATQNFLDLSCK